MPREQVGYNPQVELTQVTASPNIHTVQANTNIQGSNATQLARQLGVAFPQANSLYQAALKNEKQAAEDYANSLPVAELDKQVKDGSLLPSQSPLFVASVRHVYGNNLAAQAQQDVVSRAQAGEFETWEAAQKALIEKRNEFLSGKDEYTIAGFDKSYEAINSKLQTIQLQNQNQKNVEFGAAQANQSMASVIQAIRENPSVDGPSALADQYKFLSRPGSILFNPTLRKNALNNTFSELASKGDIELINGFLEQKLDNGITVKAAMGDDAEKYIKEGERVRQKFMLMDAAQKDDARINQLIATAVDNGRFGDIPDEMQALSANGGTTTVNTKERAQAYMQKRVQETNMSADDQVAYWSTSNIPNDAWAKKIKGGIPNLASIGWSQDGKNVGELNQQGEEALQQFMAINKANPYYAKKLVGSEKDYQLMDDIQFLATYSNQSSAGPDGVSVSKAAAIINKMNTSGIPEGNVQIALNKVSSAVDDVINPGWIHLPDGSNKGAVRAYFFGGNRDVNLTQVGSVIKRKAEILVRSGMATDVANAVDEAAKDTAANGMLINNTFYMKKDLPEIPPGQDMLKEMTRFIQEVPGKIATDQKMDGSKIRLEVGTDGLYTAMIGSVPATDANGKVMVYSKSDIGDWVKNRLVRDNQDKADDADYALYQERLRGELKALERKDPYGLSKYDSTLNGFWYHRDIGSKDAFLRLRNEGNDKKPLTELMNMTKQRRGNEKAPAQ